ncbi:MAG: hypothetical protein KIC89_22760, partial [Acetobacteraceae bacterium]|nr:hypothetical protein [Acetobacteraceae bacterium]
MPRDGIAEVGAAWGRAVAARPEVAAELRALREAATRRLGDKEVERLSGTAGWLVRPWQAGRDPAPAGLDGLARHCHVGQLWLERTRQAKLAACRPSPPPTPATVS